MYGGSGGACPDNWQTDEILKWIQDNDDSKGDIKSRVMGVVQANDLDGHTLKQLVAEKDEIQSLFPALKDRLAFKSMLRRLFKEESKVLPIEPPSNNTPKHSPPVPMASYPHKLQVVTSFPAPPSNLRFPITTTTRTYVPREGPTLPARPRELHRAVDTQHVTPKRTIADRQQMDTNSVLPKKIRDLIHTEKNFTLPSAVHFSMNTSSPINMSTQPLYFNSQSMMSPPAAKRQAHHHNDTSSSPISRSITSSSCSAPAATHTVASIQLPTTPLEPLPQTSPQISSVTSYGLGIPSVKTVASNSWLVTSSNNSKPKPYRKHNNSASAGFYRFINYPAPIPDFSDDVLECMIKTEGVRPSVRKRIMRDSAQFYVNISMGQRLNSNDYANIGRTLIEKFPALSCGGPIPWAMFNKSLSQCIRNLRRRMKKSSGGFKSLNKVEGDDLVSGSAVTFDPNDLSDEEIEEVTCIEIGEGEEDEEQDVFFIKEEIPAWTDDQVQ